MESEYHKTYSQQHYRDNKDEYKNRNKIRRSSNRILIDSFKIGGCVQCGEQDLRCLDFHHPNNDKDIAVGQMLNYTPNRIINEANKCIVLCANCHRKLHYVSEVCIGD